MLFLNNLRTIKDPAHRPTSPAVPSQVIWSEAMTAICGDQII